MRSPPRGRSASHVTGESAGDVVEVMDLSSEDDVLPLNPAWAPQACPGAPPIRFGRSVHVGGDCLYRRGREIGSGASGRVFVCDREDRAGSTRRCAVKVINLRRLQLSANALRERTQLAREVEIFKALPPHRSIVQMFDAIQEGNWFFIVLELVGEGDLFTTLTARRPPRLVEREAKFVLSQVADGLAFLHQNRVIHRDVKLENILVASEHRQRQLVFYTVKITDFGLSRFVSSGHNQAYSRVGTRHYTAPEVDLRAYDFSSDVWSLGIISYILLAGRFPFDDVPANQEDVDCIIMKVRASTRAKAFLSSLLQIVPGSRLTLSSICAFDWLQNEIQPETQTLVQGTKRHRVNEAELCSQRGTPCRSEGLANATGRSVAGDVAGCDFRHDSTEEEVVRTRIS